MDMKVLRMLAVVTMMVVLAGTLFGAEGVNPLKAGKVGDWVETKTTTDTMGTKMEQTMRQEIVKKDDASVTLKTEIAMMGQKMPAQETVIPFDTIATAPVAAGSGMVIEKIAEGDETIKIGDKEYKCHWVKNKTSMEAAGMKVEQTNTVWTCPDVPVNNMVKMVVEQESPAKSVTTQELVGCGTGK